MYFSSYFHNLLLYNNFAEGIILDYTCTYYKDSLLLQTETKNGKTGSYMLFLAFSHKKKNHILVLFFFLSPPHFLLN